MPAKWQKWYPHDIDAWQGSATIQDLSDAAYRAVHNLLQYQYQSEDGMLPGDEAELAKLSRKRSVWHQIRDEVMDCFESDGSGRVFNRRQYEEWKKARELHVKRKVGAKATNQKKNASPEDRNHAEREKKDAERTLSERTASAEREKKDAERHTYTKTKTVTKTETSTEEKQKPKATPRKSVSVEFSPPQWIPRISWDAFVELRMKLDSRSWTQGAAERTVRELERLWKLGHDPGEVLDQSVQRGWRGVFEISRGSNGAIANGERNGIRKTTQQAVAGLSAALLFERGDPGSDHESRDQAGRDAGPAPGCINTPGVGGSAAEILPPAIDPSIHSGRIDVASMAISGKAR